LPPCLPCPDPSIAPDWQGAQQRVRVTHEFHPLAGREFVLAMRKRTWGEDRVFVYDEEGQLFSLPAGWTDADPPDPYVAVSAGRSPFRMVDLLELTALIDRLRPPSRRRPVKRTTPKV
jgi:hypothetical protein